MKLINWLKLCPSQVDFQKTTRDLDAVVHVRTYLKSLVKTIINGYPWEERIDTINIFNPEDRYQIDQYIALLKNDTQELRPLTWRISRVSGISEGENV